MTAAVAELGRMKRKRRISQRILLCGHSMNCPEYCAASDWYGLDGADTEPMNEGETCGWRSSARFIAPLIADSGNYLVRNEVWQLGRDLWCESVGE